MGYGTSNSDLEFICPIGQVYNLEVIYLSGGLTFNQCGHSNCYV